MRYGKVLYFSFYTKWEYHCMMTYFMSTAVYILRWFHIKDISHHLIASNGNYLRDLEKYGIHWEKLYLLNPSHTDNSFPNDDTSYENG